MSEIDHMQEEKMEKEPLKLRSIHFLIHPGFTRDPEASPDFGIKSLRRGRDMQGSYIEQAKQLQPDECMVVFLHGSLEKTWKDFCQHQAEYKWLILELRKILGRRLIVFTDKVQAEIEDTSEEEEYEKKHQTFQTYATNLKTLLHSRGYEFAGETIKSFAYGEYMDLCVAEFANHLNIALGLRNKTTILSYRSIFSYEGPVNEVIHEARKFFPKDFTNITFTESD